jgi:uncharacterized protein (TIGR03437 family)
MYRLWLLVAAVVPLNAAALRTRSFEIPNAFEANLGQSPAQFQYLATHRNIGFSCLGIHWGRMFSSRQGVVLFDIRIDGAVLGCASELREEDGSHSIYYRGRNAAGSIGPVPRFRRLRIPLLRGVVEYTGEGDKILANFMLPNAAALRSLRKLDGASGRLLYATYLGLENGENLSSLQVDSFSRTYLRVESMSPEFPAWGNPLTGEATCYRPGFVPGEACSFLVSLDSQAAEVRYSERVGPTPRVTASGVAYLASRRFSADGELESLLEIPDGLQGTGISNEDGSMNSRENPARPGSVMRFYLVAAGPFDQPLVDGQTQHTNLARPVAPVQIHLNLGSPAELLSLAQAPGELAGYIEARVRIPASQPPGLDAVAPLAIDPQLDRRLGGRDRALPASNRGHVVS